jgi:hypothetical protein
LTTDYRDKERQYAVGRRQLAAIPGLLTTDYRATNRLRQSNKRERQLAVSSWQLATDYRPLTTGLRTDRDRGRARKEKDSRQGAEWGIGTQKIDKPVLTRIR